MTRAIAWHPIWTRRNLPLWGIACYCLLYFLACNLYPGGIRWANAELGFSVRDSYWCDLISTTTRTGGPNPARPIALFALYLLCGSLAWMWYTLPQKIQLSSAGKASLHWGGVGSMVVTGFLPTPFHDLVIHLAGLLGLIALAGTVHALWVSDRRSIGLAGVFCMILCVCNYWIYNTHSGIAALPLLQKVTFFLFLLWFVWIILDLPEHRSTNATSVRN
ncbi:MAG: hypothetical protein K9I85_13975 [Saprospiraceae bacterium]|nr:hypothetical protein [Saprospiraceae bacterium]